MVPEELNVEVNKFGELVDKICKDVKEAGHDNMCGNQIMFTRDPQTNLANVLGVCFMIPHKEHNMVYYRVLIDGQVLTMTHDATGNVVNVDDGNILTTLGEDYQTAFDSLKKIGSNLMLSAFASFIIEKQDVILAVQRAATALNNRLNEGKPVADAADATEAAVEKPDKKKAAKRKSKKTIVISDEEKK